MKVVLRMLGWLLLIVTVGLASCQALLKAEPIAVGPAVGAVTPTSSKI